MILSLRNFLRCFKRDESGTATVEFALVVPVFFTIIGMSLELGLINVRHALLERGLDVAVREIRLGTGEAPQHDQTKDMICAQSIFEDECNRNLRLEMAPADPRVYNSLDTTVDCTDQEEPTKPVRQFVAGQENQLMVIRACLKYNPLFPEALLGSALKTDSSGQLAIVTMSAFVQEPF